MRYVVELLATACHNLARLLPPTTISPVVRNDFYLARSAASEIVESCELWLAYAAADHRCGRVLRRFHTDIDLVGTASAPPADSLLLRCSPVWSPAGQDLLGNDRLASDRLGNGHWGTRGYVLCDKTCAVCRSNQTPGGYVEPAVHADNAVLGCFVPDVGRKLVSMELPRRFRRFR